jgi:hypothetical protein
VAPRSGRRDETADYEMLRHRAGVGVVAVGLVVVPAPPGSINTEYRSLDSTMRYIHLSGRELVDKLARAYTTSALSTRRSTGFTT